MSSWFQVRSWQSRAWLHAGLALLVLASAVTAGAQVAAEGSIRGRVDDGTGAAIPGVTVVATSPSVAGVFRSLSDAEGNYRVTDLPPANDYTITVELDGFSKYVRPDIIVRAGLNVRLDVSLRVGNLSEAVAVVGSGSTIIDTFSSEQSISISGELIRSLPLTGRREWSDTLQLTPGILSASTDNYGGQVYFVRGSENENHATLVDGMDVGSFRQNWPSNFISISTESLGDIQVKTGANDASSPAAMGMVISIATPTGSDAYHGAASYIFSPRDWNAKNVPNGFSAISQAYQPDFSFSGPLKRKKVWFFASGRYIYRNDGISRTDQQVTDLRKVVPDFEAFDNEARGFVYVANATVQINDKHKAFGVAQYDSRLQGGNVETQAGQYSNQQYGGGAYSARLSSVWSSKFTTRFQVSYNNKGQNDDLDRIGGLSETLPALNVYQRVQTASGGTLNGNTLLGQLNGAASRSLTPAHKATVSFDANYYTTAWGSHDIQTGIYLQPGLRTWSDTYYANNGFTTEDSVLINESNPSLGYRPFHRRYVLGNADGVLQGVRTSDIGADDYAFYVQDRWAPTKRLSISPGVRVEWIAAEDKLFDLRTQASWNIAPRIGAAYVLTADQKHVVRASWGRQTDIPNASYFDSAGNTRIATRDEYDVNGDGIFELVQSTPASTALSATQTRDPDRHQGYVQEWIVGYRTQLPGRVAVDASYVDRTYRDRPASVEINQIYELDPSVGHVVWRGLVDPTQNSITLSTNNKWNWFVYHGLEFTVTKQTKALNLLTTYTRVWNFVDGGWQPNDPASFLQPNAFPNEGGIGTVRGSGTNSIGSDTRNRSWQKHQFRIGASWRAPWDLNLSTLLTLQSGIPSGPLVTTLAAPDLSYGPATMTINGRSVSNPLSTTTRFAYATRAEGQIWTPWLKAWNARVGRRFPIGGGSSLDADLDVLNIVNAGSGQQFLGGNNVTSANFGQIQNIQTPRAVQVSVRLHF